MLWWFAPRRWFNFSGRATRRELLGYWFGIIALCFVLPVLLIASFDPGVRRPDEPANPVVLGIGVIFSLLQIAAIVATIAVEVRRFHDREKSGWNIFWGLFPGIGGLIVLVMLLMPGDDFENIYGEDPRDPDPVSAASELEQIS